MQTQHISCSQICAVCSLSIAWAWLDTCLGCLGVDRVEWGVIGWVEWGVSVNGRGANGAQTHSDVHVCVRDCVIALVCCTYGVARESKVVLNWTHTPFSPNPPTPWLSRLTGLKPVPLRRMRALRKNVSFTFFIRGQVNANSCS